MDSELKEHKTSLAISLKTHNRKKEEFSDTYKKYSNLILKYIYFKVSDIGVAEDILQETFIKTWQYIKNNHTINNQKRFLYMVAKNLIIDHYRQKEKKTIPLDKVNAKSIAVKSLQESEVDKKINLKLIKKHLARLDDKYKRIVTFRYINNLDIGEICELTGKSPNYISVLLYKGVKLLKEKVSKDGQKSFLSLKNQGRP